MKKLIVLLLIAINISAFAQKDKTPPTVTNFTAFVSGDNLIVDADVTDETLMYAVFYYVEPIGQTSWKPERNVGKYLAGQAIHAMVLPSETFDWRGSIDISNIASGTYILRIDAWDAAKNLTRQEIQITK